MAVECLKKRYNKPPLLYQTHMIVITEVPGPTARNFIVSMTSLANICGVKKMGYDPSGAFVTLPIEMKLNWSMMLEWQKHTQENSDVPHYTDILEYIDLRARPSETVLRVFPTCHSQLMPRKDSAPVRTVCQR